MSEQIGVSQRWAARPLQAWSVRGIVLLAPLAGSFAFVHFASVWLKPPTGSLWLYLSWWFGLSAAATVVLFGVDRFSRRLLPLSALLKLSLAFPDETPSRLKTALRSGNVDTLEKRLKLVHEAKAAATPRESAERLLELVAALNVHDRLTRGHSERVRAYSVLIGKELGLSEHDLDLLNWAALLHDIGKLEVRQGILTKPGKPSDEEWQMLRQHPLFGEDLTAPLSEWLAAWQAAVGYHHERWDGKGYPRGLSGEEIPLAGRIVAVADVYDVITSARSYKHAGNSVEGRQEIARCAGAQFDPRVVRAFLNVSLGRMRMIMGPLSWLSHAPLLARLPLTPAIGTLAGTLSVVAAAAISGAVSHPFVTPTRAAVAIEAALPVTAPAFPRPQTTPHPSNPRIPLPRPTAFSVNPTPSGTAIPVTSLPNFAPAGMSVPPPSASPAAARPAPTGQTPPPSKVAPDPLVVTSPHGPDPTPATSVASSGTRLLFTSQPSAATNVVAGTSFALEVSAEDQSNNPVTTDNTTTVTLSLRDKRGRATLTCTNPGGAGPVTVVSGGASFTCSLDKAGEGYTLTASDTTGGSGHPYTSATSNAFNVTAGPPTQLVFTTQPVTTAAGSTVTPAVQVSVEDAHGNIETADNTTTVTVAIGANPGASTLSGTLTQTVSGGVATFNNLSLNTTANGYTLTASSSPAHGTTTSNAFNVTAGPPTQLVFTTQPVTTAAGSTVTPAVQVSVEDAHGNIETADNTTTVTVAIGANPGASTLSGTLTQTVSGGVATFNNLSLNTTANGYTLTASSSPAHGTTTSNAFNVTAGPPTQLVFTTQPVTTAAGSTVTPAVQVSVEDAHGNIETADNTTTVTVAIGANPGASTLSGTLTQTVSGGVATFNNLSLNTTANGYTLTASSSPAHGTTTSNAFNVTAGPPTQLVFTTQPVTTAAGSTVTPAVQVSVEDAHGNIETADNTTTVTVAIGANPGASTLSGTLTQTVSGGVATFNNLSLNTTANGYTLTASSSPAHGTTTSNAFNVTAGPPTQLVFTTQPVTTAAGSTVTPAVQVSVEDAHGNIETADNTTTVTVAIGANPGASTLSGTLTQTVSGGVATFNNLSLNTTANGYTLTASSSPAHGTTTSNAFNVTAGPPTQLVFTTQPVTTAAGSTVTPAVQVSVEDAHGNIETADNTTTVTVAIGANPGASTLSGTLTQTVSGGVATFNNLSLNTTANGYTLTASSSPAHGTTTSNAFNVTAGPPTQLVFTTQPVTTAAGSTVTPAVQVSVEDAHGNIETADNTTTVTVAIGANPGASTLSGTLTQTVSGGVATFNNLSLNTTANGYTLTASSSPAHGTTTSNAFNVTAGPPTQLVFTTQPVTTAAGSTVTPAVQVSVEDAHGNIETADNTTTVTVAIGANPGASTLSGTLTQTVSGGVATFNNLSLNTTANGYTLTASSSPAHGTTTSNAFNVTAGPPTQLVFTTQPVTTAAGSTVTPAVQVSVEDAHGNIETADNTTTVTVAIGANPGASTLSGTLTQTVSGGVATFNNLSLNTTANGYTLTASSSPAHGTTTSATFDITTSATVGGTLLTSNSGSPCTSGASCTTASISPTAGETLLILIQRGGSTSSSDSVTSITGPLIAATSAASIEYPSAAGRNYLFAWTATATGSTGTVTVNIAGGSNANPTVIDVIQLTGNNTTTPIAQAPTASGTSLLLGSASANLTTPNTSNGEIVIASFLANQAITTPAGFTAIDNMNTGSNGGEDYGVYFNPSAQTTTSITAPGLGLATGWGTIALEINHA